MPAREAGPSRYPSPIVRPFYLTQINPVLPALAKVCGAEPGMEPGARRTVVRDAVVLYLCRRTVASGLPGSARKMFRSGNDFCAAD